MATGERAIQCVGYLMSNTADDEQDQAGSITLQRRDLTRHSRHRATKNLASEGRSGSWEHT